MFFYMCICIAAFISVKKFENYFDILKETSVYRAL